MASSLPRALIAALLCFLALESTLAVSSEAIADTSPLKIQQVQTPSTAAAVPATTQVGSSEDLDAVTKISSATISAAKDEVELTKWIFTAGSVIVTILVGGLGFLGYKNISGIAEDIRKDARHRIDEELGAFRDTIGAATELAVRTQSALRHVYLAEKWSDGEESKRNHLARAISAIRDARTAASTMKDEATVHWTHSFEAYCLGGQQRYSEAVGEQLIAMQSTNRDPVDLYNLACYQARAGALDQAKATLIRAVGSTGDIYRRHAASDEDFAEMRNRGMLEEVLRGVVPEQPDKAPPSLPKNG